LKFKTQYAIQWSENRVGEVLQTMVRRKEVCMEVNVGEIKVNIKLKIIPRRRGE